MRLFLDVLQEGEAALHVGIVKVGFAIAKYPKQAFMEVVRTLLIRGDVSAQTIDPGPQLGPAVVCFRVGLLPPEPLSVGLAGMRVEVHLLRLLEPIAGHLCSFQKSRSR